MTPHPDTPETGIRLSRLDKFAYGLYWLSGHACGIFPYDWVRDWNVYLRCRERGMTAIEAFCWLPERNA